MAQIIREIATVAIIHLHSILNGSFGGNLDFIGCAEITMCVSGARGVDDGLQ